MESTDRSLGPWVAVLWGGLAAVAWVSNGISAVTSDAGPSLDALVFALALAMAGLSIGIAVNVFFALGRWGRYSRGAVSDDPALWLLPMGIGMLGLAMEPVFDGSVSSLIAWVWLAGCSLASGFTLGVAPEVRIHRYRFTATSTDAETRYQR